MHPATQHARQAVVVLALALLVGCSDKTPGASNSTTPGTAAAPESPAFSYTVRGKVVTIPSADRPMDDLSIHHEAIPDFKNRDGVVFENTTTGTLGMKSMVMPFPVDDSVSLDEIEVGDIIEFTFLTVWGEDYPDYKVTAIRKLPADTELNFEN